MIEILMMIGSVLVYLFVAIFVFTYINEKGKKTCRYHLTKYCDGDCPHFVAGLFVGGFWPVGIPIALGIRYVIIPLSKCAAWFSRWFAKVI